MNLFNSANQQRFDSLFDATTTLGTGATLVLPRNLSRSFLSFQNLSAHSMAVEIGCARATATLTNGVVTGFTITNAGFGFTAPPIIELLGGGYGGNTAWSPVGMIGYPKPHGGLNNGGNSASVRAVLSGGALSSITILNGGNGYIAAPFVYIRNSDLDPFGAALPNLTSSGFLLPAASPPIILNGTFLSTDAVSVIGTSGDILAVKFAP